jgi:hypothetical protein
MTIKLLYEKKSLLIIGIAGILVFIVFIWALIIPVHSAFQKNSARAKQLEEELSSTWNMIRNRSSVKKELNVTIKTISENSQHIPLPTLGNYRLGMEQYVRTCGSGANVSIEQIFKQGIVELKDGNNLFSVYRIRVVLKAGYKNLSEFIKEIESNNKMVAVSDLTISISKNDPKIHNVSLVLSWLIWKDPAKKPGFLEESS